MNIKIKVNLSEHFLEKALKYQGRIDKTSTKYVVKGIPLSTIMFRDILLSECSDKPVILSCHPTIKPIDNTQFWHVQALPLIIKPDNNSSKITPLFNGSINWSRKRVGDVTLDHYHLKHPHSSMYSFGLSNDISIFNMTNVLQTTTVKRYSSNIIFYLYYFDIRIAFEDVKKYYKLLSDNNLISSIKDTHNEK